ncbi:THAP domain-containing protein 2 [Trichonephila clavipes]|uniref:THAP domain-containing protein 2 n=1 Tax=Trichonephila clavipes TaxID=2585209 RepID=A0A8X6WCR5_TRICX|nr:THAP domain-containing protein 2 [Trichonephila clavipes]
MIRRENFKPSAHSLICSDHFEETCFEYQPFTNRRQLKRGSIPTIFVFKKKASSRRILDRCKPSTSVIFLQIEDDLSMGTKRRPIDRYFLFLVKLRTGISNEFLAILFGISDSTVSRDFNFVTDVLYEKLKLQDVFPSKDQVIRYMPPPFRMYCKNVRIIVDCTEIEVQKPSSPMEQQMTFSRYKMLIPLKVWDHNGHSLHPYDARCQLSIRGQGERGGKSARAGPDCFLANISAPEPHNPFRPSSFDPSLSDLQVIIISCL